MRSLTRLSATQLLACDEEKSKKAEPRMSMRRETSNSQSAISN